MTDSLVGILCFILLCSLLAGPGRDDSDSPDSRSGLRVYTDHKTGCQYLGTIFGSITPRLDRDGKIVCVQEEAKKP